MSKINGILLTVKIGKRHHFIFFGEEFDLFVSFVCFFQSIEQQIDIRIFGFVFFLKMAILGGVAKGSSSYPMTI